MNTILAMSLFGSSMILIYILIKNIMKEQFTARIACFMLKVTMFFFWFHFRS